MPTISLPVSRTAAGRRAIAAASVPSVVAPASVAGAADAAARPCGRAGPVPAAGAGRHGQGQDRGQRRRRPSGLAGSCHRCLHRVCLSLVGDLDPSGSGASTAPRSGGGGRETRSPCASREREDIRPRSPRRPGLRGWCTPVPRRHSRRQPRQRDRPCDRARGGTRRRRCRRHPSRRPDRRAIPGMATSPVASKTRQPSGPSVTTTTAAAPARSSTTVSASLRPSRSRSNPSRLTSRMSTARHRASSPGRSAPTSRSRTSRAPASTEVVDHGPGVPTAVPDRAEVADGRVDVPGAAEGVERRIGELE